MKLTCGKTTTLQYCGVVVEANSAISELEKDIREKPLYYGEIGQKGTDLRNLQLFTAACKFLYIKAKSRKSCLRYGELWNTMEKILLNAKKLKDIEVQLQSYCDPE